GSVDRFPWRTLEDDPPDVIFHLARIAGRGGIRGTVTRLRNRVANERLVLGLAAWARPPLVVYVGGTLAYGSRGEALVTEQTPLAPTSFSRDYHHAELPWLRAIRGNEAPVRVAALPIRRISLDDVERRFGRAVRQAFDFSARVGTVHEALHAGYTIEHQDLDGDLAALLRST